MPFTANRPVQAGAADVRRRRGHALHHQRRPQGARRHRGALVLQRRALPAADQRRRSPSRRRSSTTRRRSRWAIPKAFELANRLIGMAPEGMEHAFFTNSGLGVGRDGAEDRHRLPAGDRAGDADPADRARARLSRGELRRHLGRRHRQQPQVLRDAADRRRPPAAHPPAGAEPPGRRASPSTGRSSPTSSSGSWRCTTPRRSRR